MRATHRRPGFIAAMLHRLSGIALALFLPLHFLALGSALKGASEFERFLKFTATPLIKIAEFGIVTALAIHMTLGLRILAVEFLDFREHTATVVSVCLAAGFGVGLAFLLNHG